MQRRELGKQLREAVSQKKKLRKALLDSQKEGQNILAEIGEVKKQHKHSEEKRKKTEQAHDFLNHFEILQEDVRGSKDNVFPIFRHFDKSRRFLTFIQRISTP